MSKEIISAYFPYRNEGNRYTANIQRCIRAAGVKIIELQRYTFPLKDFFACKIFNFNWIEDRITDNASTPFRQWLKYIRMCLVFDFIKIKGGKIIWTMHNKMPHSAKNRKYKVKLMRKIARRASAVVIHCEDSIQPLRALYKNINLNKVYLINHPSYIGSYAPSGADLRARLNIPADRVVLMFIGAARRYKNIEALIIAFKKANVSGMTLLVAGETEDKAFASELRELAEDSPDIVFDDRFIPDGEMADYFAAADIAVLPYNIETSLNSGSVYMSFSMRTTVICPQIGSINQLKDKSFIYSYSYKNDDEHIAALKGEIERVAADIKADPSALKKRGEQAYSYVSTEHSDERITADYAKLYKKLAGVK